MSIIYLNVQQTTLTHTCTHNVQKTHHTVLKDTDITWKEHFVPECWPFLLPTSEWWKVISISAFWQRDQTCGSLSSLNSRYESTLHDIITQKTTPKTIVHACAKSVPKQKQKQKQKQKDAKDANLMNKYEKTHKIKSMRTQIPSTCTCIQGRSSMWRTEALASVKFYQMLSIFFSLFVLSPSALVLPPRGLSPRL